MIQKNVPLLILSGLFAGILLAFTVMAVVPYNLTGSPGTDATLQPIMHQNVTAGSGDLPQFSSSDEARTFL
ncbi:MAG: hypothetical protein PHN79_10495, partial [Methanoregula sp.]|nr:hypothetical protein [Methanoregula sp.]